jgi:hypothetical protein
VVFKRAFETSTKCAEVHGMQCDAVSIANYIVLMVG